MRTCRKHATYVFTSLTRVRRDAYHAPRNRKKKADISRPVAKETTRPQRLRKKETSIMAKALHLTRALFGRIALLEMTSSLTTHSHPQLHLIVKVGGADGLFEVAGDSVALTDHQAVVVDSWEPHAYQHGHRDASTLVLACYLEPLWVTSLLGFHGFRLASRQRGLPLSEELRKRLRKLAFETVLDEHCAQEHITSWVSALVLDIRDSFRDAHVAAVACLEKRSDDRRLAAILRHMGEHMDDRMDIDAVAKRFGLSRPHLYYLFNQRLGLPPHVCWNAMRMEYALQRLGQDRRSGIKQVAFDLGFNSQSNFTRFFRSIQGVSPREYQAAANGDSARSAAR